MFIHGLLGLLHGICNNMQHCSVPKSKEPVSHGKQWTNMDKAFCDFIMNWEQHLNQPVFKYWSDIFNLTHLISGNFWKSLHYNIRKWVQFKWSVSIFKFDVVFDSYIFWLKIYDPLICHIWSVIWLHRHHLWWRGRGVIWTWCSCLTWIHGTIIGTQNYWSWYEAPRINSKVSIGCRLIPWKTGK